MSHFPLSNSSRCMTHDKSFLLGWRETGSENSSKNWESLSRSRSATYCRALSHTTFCYMAFMSRTIHSRPKEVLKVLLSTCYRDAGFHSELFRSLYTVKQIFAAASVTAWMVCNAVEQPTSPRDQNLEWDGLSRAPFFYLIMSNFFLLRIGLKLTCRLRLLIEGSMQPHFVAPLTAP